MLGWNLQDWNGHGVEDRQNQFACQRWAEIFAADSADSWQLRTTNVRALLCEVVSVCRTCREYPPASHHLVDVLRELEYQADFDPVAKRHFAFLHSCMKPLATESKPDIQRAESLAGVLITKLDGYRQDAISDLLEALSQNRSLTDLEPLVLCIGTELANSGYSSEFLSEAFNSSVLDRNSEPFDRRIRLFLYGLDCKEKSYRVTFLVQWPRTLKDYNSGDIVITVGPPSDLPSLAHRDFFSEAQVTNLYATITVEALDPFAARSSAEGKMAEVLAVLNLWLPESSYGIIGNLALVDCDGSEVRTIGRSNQHENYMRDASNAREPIQRFLSLRLDDEDREQMLAALQYHRLGLMSPTLQSRLVNMWVALACLLRRESSDSIDVLCAAVGPLVAQRNIIKQTRALSRYIRKVVPIDSARTLFGRLSNNGHVPWRELLIALIHKPEIISKLCEYSSHSALLTFRIGRLQERLSDGKALASSFDRHFRNVDWQLRRIYRARNDIVHRGKVPPRPERLLQNLHSYLKECCHLIIDDLASNPKWSVPNVFEYRRASYEALARSLRQDKISARALMRPDRLLSPS